MHIGNNLDISHKDLTTTRARPTATPSTISYEYTLLAQWKHVQLLAHRRNHAAAVQPCGDTLFQSSVGATVLLNAQVNNARWRHWQPGGHVNQQPHGANVHQPKARRVLLPPLLFVPCYDLSLTFDKLAPSAGRDGYRHMGRRAECNAAWESAAAEHTRARDCPT